MRSHLRSSLVATSALSSDRTGVGVYNVLYIAEELLLMPLQKLCTLYMSRAICIIEIEIILCSYCICFCMIIYLGYFSCLLCGDACIIILEINPLQWLGTQISSISTSYSMLRTASTDRRMIWRVWV